MECYLCGNEEAIPFKCRYCSLEFCGTHRLPVNHRCPFVQDYKEQPKRAKEFIDHVKGESGSAGQRIPAIVRNAVVLRFSRVELLHLFIGTALVTAVGLSINDYRFTWEFLAIFISAFILHEFAHKFLAQIYHAFAEFRVFLYGAVITAISALPILPFKFIAPGAVVIFSPLSEGRIGRVSLVGPLTNLAMGLGFILTHYVSPQTPYMLAGASFNGWIALFNLIPFMGLDGQKILSWNKIIWVLTMAGAVLLFLAGNISRGRFFGLF